MATSGDNILNFQTVNMVEYTMAPAKICQQIQNFQEPIKAVGESNPPESNAPAVDNPTEEAG